MSFVSLFIVPLTLFKARKKCLDRDKIDIIPVKETTFFIWVYVIHKNK